MSEELVKISSKELDNLIKVQLEYIRNYAFLKTYQTIISSVYSKNNEK